MADLDFSAQAEPVASPAAPDFSASAEPVKKVSALSMAGRQFVGGGGDVLNALDFVNQHANPAAMVSTGISNLLGEQDANPLPALAENAHEFAQLAPNETPDGLTARVAGGAARMLPSMAAAIGTGGESSLAGVVPNALRGVPYVGRFLTGMAAGAPTAGALTGIQATNLPADMSTGDKVATTAKDLGLNLAMAGLPLAVGSSPLARAATGGAIGYGSSAAASAIQGQPQDQAQNLVGGLMGTLLGQHSAEVPGAPLDPYIARYNATSGEPAATARPEGPALLPAPDFAAQAEPATPSTPVPESLPSAPAPEAFNPKLAETIFKADPRTALASLDHPTLVQVAKDAGFDVGPGEGAPSIIGKIVSQPTAFIHSDVLPEYMAAISPNSPTPEAAPPLAPQAPVAQNMAQASELGQSQTSPSMASVLTPNSHVAVDSAGTAYTPDQGMGQILAGMVPRETPALPAPVTTVDSHGNARDSGTFLREARQAASDAEAAAMEKSNRSTLGITPDIERTQAPGWKAREAAQADIQARQDARDAENGDLATQRTDDAPPWWLAGEHAADENDDEESNAVVGQRDDDSPPWWVAGQHEDAMWEPPVKPLATDEAVHADPGEKPEAATPAVIGESMGKAVDHTALDRAGAKRDILTKITDAQKDANAEPWPVIPNGGPRMQAAKNERERIIKAAGYVSIDVPGDGKFQVVNNRQALDAFRDKVEKNPGFKKPTTPTFGTKPSLRMSPADRAKVMGEAEDTGELSQNNSLAQPDGSAGDHSAVPQADRRDDYSPRVDRHALTEIQALVDRFDGSTLADSIAQDFREHQGAALVGQTISSHDDLAALGSVYRNPAFETMRYIYVDDAGNVLGETAVSSRMPSTVIAFPSSEKNGVKWIMESAPKGATGVWLAHNHPSADPKPSQQDIDFTGELAIKLSDTAGAPKVRGHVVLDHDTFGRISAAGEDMGIGKVRGAGPVDPLRNPVGESFYGANVASPSFAAGAAKRIASMTPKDSTAVIVMGNAGQVVSVHTFPNDVLATPKGYALISRIGNKRGAVGIGIVTSSENFAKHYTAFKTAHDRRLIYDAVVVNNEGTALSLGQNKQMSGALFGKHTAGSVQRKKQGAQLYEGGTVPEPKPQGEILSLSRIRQLLADRGMSADDIAGMSRDQLRAEQANFRARSAPTPETTGIKNATVAEERAMKGDAEVEHDLSRTDQQGWDDAKARLARDPNYGTDLAASFVKNPRPATKEETFALSQDRMRISKERRAAYDVAEKARTSGTQSDQLRAQQRIDALDAQMEANDVAGRVTGYETASGLAARRALSREDYSMASLVTQGKVKAGRALTSEERSQLEQRAKDIEEREAAVAKREADIRARRRNPDSPKVAASAKARFDDLATQLRKIAEKDQLKPGCVV